MTAETTDRDDVESEVPEPSAELLPEDLPPVEPPSAGFIVQLFLVPAIIVMAVVGVWLLFGKIASSEQDWHTHVRELGNSNEHRRWRGALGLAQMLQTDRRLENKGQRLSRNTEIARELSDMMRRELARHSQREDDLKQQAFLARTLGQLDVPDVVLPVLEEATGAEHDREIRKNSIASIAVIAGRAIDRGETMESESLSDCLIEVSTDSDPLIRQLAAYALGLIPGDKSQERLMVLLEDADEKTRVNAAVALARKKLTAGLPLFTEILKQAAKPSQSSEPSTDEFRPVILQNTLRAIRALEGVLSSSQRKQLVIFIEPISKTHPEPRLRTDALDTLRRLGEGK